MLTPMQARAVLAHCTVLAGALLLGACAGDVSSPSAAPSRTMEGTSMYAPTAAQKSLVGVADGTYAVTFDPTHKQSFALGPNHLDIPANAVCDLESSGYGMSYWDKPCNPEHAPLTLTVVIRNAASDHPSMDFFPAMRFNPAKRVELYMYAPHVTLKDATDWVMLYCPDTGSCIDESITDRSLRTVVDYRENMLFRRVKHFSGYTVAERAVDAVESLVGQ